MTREAGFADKARNSGWRDLPRAAVIPEAANAAQYETGDWRSIRPVWKSEQCKHCLFCWVYCPENAIMVEDGKVVGINYKHCKGCGICAKECPGKVQAIDMISENSATE